MFSTLIAAFLLLAAVRPSGAAGDRSGARLRDGEARLLEPAGDGEEIAFDEAELFFELNDTDGDLGIQGLIDGDDWAVLTIADPAGHRILRLTASGRLRRQGLTELSFESAEPTFDEFDPEDFFLRFPEGTYAIQGITLDDERLAGEAELSHVLAAPVSNITISGVAAADTCDDELPVVSGPVVIRWDPVVSSHPELGSPGSVDIVRYQFFVEMDDTEMGVDLPPTVTEFEVPGAILALGNSFKFEIIARTSSGNNTAVESCFLTE